MFKYAFKNFQSVFKDIVEEDGFVIDINKYLYKKLCKGVEGNCIIRYDLHFGNVYYIFENYVLMSITDKKYAHALYLAIYENRRERFPYIHDFKFLTTSKHQEVVFVIADKYFIDKAHIDNIYRVASNFANLITTKESKLYFNYLKFFKNVCNYNAPVPVALLSAVNFTSSFCFAEDNNTIIDYIFSLYTLKEYSSRFGVNVQDLRKQILSGKGSFFSWLSKGVYISEYSPFKDIPLYFLINFVKYALKPDSFTDISDFFNFNNDYMIYPTDATQNIIIDKDIFLGRLIPDSQNEYFVNYTDSKRVKYSKLKDIKHISKLENIMDKLSSDNLISNSKTLSCPDGETWIVSTSVGITYYSLTDYIGNCELCNFETFLIRFHDTLINKYSSLENLSFQKDTNLLDLITVKNNLCTSEEKDIITFSNLNSLALDEDKDNISFDYILIMMMVIRKYLSDHNMDITNLKAYEFMKMFHPSFIQLLKEYLVTGNYDAKNVPEDLNQGVIISYNTNQIEYVENIDLDDSHLLGRISFYDNAKVNQSLVDAVNKEKQVSKAKGFITLDDYITPIKSNNVSRVNIKSILYYHTQEIKDFLLLPEKILISGEDDFKIVGVVWNYCCLSKAIDVLKTGYFNCKQLYAFIVELLSLCTTYGYSFKDASSLANHLTINMSNNKPVLTKYALKNMVYRSTAGWDRSKAHYEGIISLFESHGIFTTGYDIFSWKDVTADCEDVAEAFNAFCDLVQKMQLCKKHNHWYTPTIMCPSCKKLYAEVGRFERKDSVYSDSVAKIQKIKADNGFTYLTYNLNYNNNSNCSLRENIISRVELGIYHNLYKGFILAPQKIAVSTTKRRKATVGIVFDKTKVNFSHIININTFKNMQRLKLILVLYKKLLPRILNQSFIATNPVVFDTMFMSQDYKGEIIIPNIPLMECDVVLSSDTELKLSKQQETKKIFANFLINYIMTDEFLSNMINHGESYFVNIVDNIKQLKFSEKTIRKCLAAYSNYCLVHARPFSTEQRVCPICSAEGIVEDKILVYDKKYFDKLEKTVPPYDGGEANIYPSADDTVAHKIFKDGVDLKFKTQILAKALERETVFNKFNEEHSDIKIISILNLLYMKENGVLVLKGFTQPFIKDSYKISSLKDIDFIKSHNYKREDIVEILIKVCKGIEFLHANGGFIGDLNGGNILIKDKKVFFIDIDGMSFDEVQNSVYTNMYIYPPSAESNNITAKDDWYSLAVQAFYYLTRSHPFRGVCENQQIPSNEIERMSLGLSIIGNHSITPPNISIGWNFLPQNLIQYFLETFEGSRRESMLELLEAYHKHIMDNKLIFSEIERKHAVKININEFAYIDSKFNLVCNEEIITPVRDCRLIISKEDGFIIVMNNSSCFYNYVTQRCIIIDKTYSKGPINISNGRVYHTSYYKDTIYIDDLSNPPKVSTKIMPKSTSQEIVDMSIIDEKNMLLVQKSKTKDNHLDIYFNSTKLTSFSFYCNNNDKNNVCIRYDKLSRKWIVLLPYKNMTKGVIVEQDTGKFTPFAFSKVVNTSSCFYGNSLYFCGNKEILSYNTNTGHIQCIDCSEVTPSSIVKRKDNKFYIINPTSVYVFEKS